jgi:DNA polymerase-3 subunit delta
MIIFLYGQDSYRINQKLQEIISGYKTKNPSGLNLIRLDFAENKPEDFFEAVKSDSLIPEKKLIILKNVFSAQGGPASGRKTNSELFLEFLESRNFDKRDDVILVAIEFRLSSGNRNSEGKLFEYLTKKPNQAQKFELLKEYEVKNWIRKSLNANGIEIASDALDFFISSCGLDLWRLDSEIKKIADFSAESGSVSGGKIRRVINKSQLEDLIISSVEHNIFELTDALAKKNKKRALLALFKALDNGEKPTELLGLMAWQVRNLLRFKISTKSSELKLHPFVLEKTKEAAKYFSMNELNAILSKIINLDLTFKTSDVDVKSALSLLISEL